MERYQPVLQRPDLGVGADRDRGLLLRRGSPAARLLFHLPSFSLEVDLSLAERVVSFVQEAPFVAQELLPFLELPLSLVDPIHDAAELVLAADEVRLPFLQFAASPLP